ncbi:starch synthase [Nitrosomonas sp. Nm51]|uniref:glycogen synthase GlgA n=1 Tax=Nitrosomonas sp. Nm51 TaxID=133720 RepID=UPI0008CE2D2D|nr:glycogen synthase GlgA [Nitrosomonas sp. Nm51]SER44829.1 starch synthase [Nitrosomonas sp. Nm51]
MTTRQNKPKLLFATSEVHPLIKTGGLADVSGALPIALQKLGCDVRVILPAYGDILESDLSLNFLAETYLPGVPGKVSLLSTHLEDSPVQVWLVGHSSAFARRGNPYMDVHGDIWPDNAERFALFCKVIVLAALDRLHLGWKPDVVHCNDWQTALVPALLKQTPEAPPCLFTIHNLAYQGLFPQATFDALGLPATLWSPEGLEFHGQLSFIKGGLVFANRINTVSAQYAKEIQTHEMGYGLEGLLQYRREELSGIINGIDDAIWNPKTDPLIAQNYSAKSLAKKKVNKTALQEMLQLPAKKDIFMLGCVSRLVEQKGVDLILEFLETITDKPLQFCLLGTGDLSFQKKFVNMAKKNPKQISVIIGYDEKLAHQIEAGADVFIMPSRFEPCGLNQLYSMRYGTVPVVHHVGGLVDTVVDATDKTIADATATGFVFNQPTVAALSEAINRAHLIFNKPRTWQKIVRNNMNADFTWQKSAGKYLDLYQIMQQPFSKK